MSGIACCVITDGRRDCIERTIASVESMTTGIDPAMKFIYDDSASPMHREFLRQQFEPLGYKITNGLFRQGFAGAVRAGWDILRGSSAEWLTWLEDDFVFNEPIDWVELTVPLVLDERIAQMSLKRQAWSPEEIAAGGFVELNPDAYSEARHSDLVWTEHTVCFSTNPSIFHRSIVENHEWPEGSESEGHFTIKLRDAGYRFGIWGGKFDPPKVTHIGETRRGKGY